MALTTKEKFEQFHAANPQVAAALVEMTRAAKEAGRDRIAIGMLVEVLRWEHYLTTRDANTPFKICNNYKPHYARLIMEEHPEFEGMFELKEMKDGSDDPIPLAILD